MIDAHKLGVFVGVCEALYITIQKETKQEINQTRVYMYEISCNMILRWLY